MRFAGEQRTLHGQSTQHDIEQYRVVGASTHAGSSPMNAGHEPESKRHRKDEVPKLRSRKWVKKRRKKQNTEALHMSAAASNASPPALVAQDAIGPSVNLHISFPSSHPFQAAPPSAPNATAAAATSAETESSAASSPA